VVVNYGAFLSSCSFHKQLSKNKLKSSRFLLGGKKKGSQLFADLA